MWDSIQENIKKINSYLSYTDCVSLLITVLFLALFTAFLYIQKINSYVPVKYIKSENMKGVPVEDSRPFASVSGKTYTFSWCQNSSAISSKNKIYFLSEEDAQKSGRTLSKLCQK